MTKVRFKSGFVFKQTGIKGDQQGINDLTAAFEEQAKCDACGCSTCYGYWTNINTTTGDLMMMYIADGEGGPELIIEPFEDGLVNVKAAKVARDAA